MKNNYYSEYNESSANAGPVIVSDSTTKTLIKSYLWMFIGTFITFVFGIVFSNMLANMLLEGNGAGLSVFLILSIVSFVVQLILCYTINKNALVKANFSKALIGFIVFALSTGFTFSTLFIYFDISILYNVFAGVTLYYLILTFLTFLFRKSIHKASGFAFVGLLTLLICSVLVSIYSLVIYDPIGGISSKLYLGISVFWILVFSILTMVDIKSMYNLIDYSQNKKSASIAAAFSLYLDFINIFLYVLRILLILGKNIRNNN